jgi:DNA-binding CsgD family transcriptional regulator
MNYTTKEIARIFNIKPPSIQKARVRLKKKLGLLQEDDLFQFIHDLK